jgi:hypothetical protein
VAQYSTFRQNHFGRRNKDLHEVVMLADKDGNLQNTGGAASNIRIANGDLGGYTPVHKFGAVDGTVGTSWSTVWSAAETSGQQLYPWPAIGDASVVTVVSTSGSDTTTVTLEGLDVNYAFQSETLTLTGTVAVTGNLTWHRINRAFMSGTATNVGTIIVKNATPTVITEIKAERGQTQQAFYTVPAGCTGFLNTVQMTSSKNQAVEVAMFARPFGGAFRVVGGVFLYQSDHTIAYATPIKLTEKTDIDIRAIGAANGVISASFDLLIVDNSVLT